MLLMQKDFKSLFLILSLCVFIISLTNSFGRQAPLIGDKIGRAIAEELSGETAKRNLEFLSQHHRMRASKEFRKVAEYIEAKLISYGLEQVEIMQFAADGKTMHGTQKARPAWDAEFAELWEMKQDQGNWINILRIASYDAMPIILAQDSESGEVSADLIDVGTGTNAADYEGKDVKGKLVLVASQPGAVASLAVEKYGAAGIVSYAQNQRSAWWKENDNLVRWGHLSSFTETKTFAFMISLKQARNFQQRLASGEQIRLHAIVKAGKHEGFYDIVTAVIPGTDPMLRNEEIAFSCHLDHQKPGANDNASGSVTILEIARVYSKLIREGKLPKPKRTIRFIWPPEIEGTITLLNRRPLMASNIKAVIHMDMVGGTPETKAVFHVSRSPKSLPSFINDVAEYFGRFVNEQSDAFAGGSLTSYPLVSPEGGKESLRAILGKFSMGSDHQVYTDGSFRIPAIYLHEWPDRYIHTNFDLPEHIDPTKLKRAGFIGAASAWFLANFSTNDKDQLWEFLQQQILRRTAEMLDKRKNFINIEAENLVFYHWKYERDKISSIRDFDKSISIDSESFFSQMEKITGPGKPIISKSTEADLLFERNNLIKGPLSVFGYNYLSDHYGENNTQKLALLNYSSPYGSGGVYAYEILNLVNGKRSAMDIRNEVSAEFGPVPLEIVVEYLKALESIGIVNIK